MGIRDNDQVFENIGRPINQSQDGPFRLSEYMFHSNNDWSLYATVVQRTEVLRSGKKLPVMVLLHGGGPDHHSLMPLARQLTELCTVILPDIRGYGRSICADPTLHTWAQYTNDVITLLDKIGASTAIVGGAGLGATLSLRVALAFPNRVDALVLISVEDVENEESKKAEIAFMEAFANRVRTQGIEAAWDPILKDLSPIIGSLVRDAIPRSNAESIAAAASIGYDRSFKNVKELAEISVPTLIIPGIDWRHPKAFAEHLANIIPNGKLAPVTLSLELQTAEDFGEVFSPVIRDFLIRNIG